MADMMATFKLMLLKVLFLETILLFHDRNIVGFQSKLIRRIRNII